MRDAAKELFDALSNEAHIQALIVGQVENLYIDFKTKRVPENDLVDDDLQKNLSKGISGFANADGGVLILGVEEPRGQPRVLQAITPHVLFEQQVNSYISRATAFVVQGVLVKSIPIPSQNGGVVAVYVPKSEQAPHCSLKDKKYYQRIGDSFLAMEHYQIADLFGKRHQPVILPIGLLKADVNTRGRIELVLGLRNDGRAVGRFPYLKIGDRAGFVVNKFGISNDGRFGLPPFSTPAERLQEYRGGADHVIHPGVELQITRLMRNCGLSPDGILTDPPTEIIIGGMVAADGFPARAWRLTIPRQTIQDILANPRAQQSANLVGELL